MRHPERNGARIRAFEHDYGTKSRKEAALGDVVISGVGDKVFWIDVPTMDGIGALDALGVDPEVLESLGSDLDTPVVKYRGDLFRFDMIHVPFEEWERTEELVERRIRCLLGPRFLVTVHDGGSVLVDRLLKGYVTDFQATSKGAIFLVYEMFHHVLNAYLKIHGGIQLKLRIIDDEVATADEGIIRAALELHHKLLAFREVAHSSRHVLNFLASRASLFVSQNTKPYLDNMSMVLERLDDDLSVDRQIISDSVEFYVSIVSYRMNISIRTMTAVNVTFVPLTLLATIYGMNFVSMPELEWRFGYAFFWALFLITFMASLIWLKKIGGDPHPFRKRGAGLEPRLRAGMRDRRPWPGGPGPGSPADGR